MKASDGAVMKVITWHEELTSWPNSNAEFIDEMIADPVFADMMADEAPQHSHDHGHHGHDHGHSHGHEFQHEEHDHSHGPHGGHGSHGSHGSHGDDAKKSRQAENDLAQDKVRSTLRSIVRDWASEGAQERANCYDPCLSALERYFPQTSQGSSVDVSLVMSVMS